MRLRWKWSGMDGGAGSTSYMWVHRSGEMYREKPVVLYEYQKTRNSSHPKEFYKDYKGILVTDGLEQYHKIERDLPGLRNANCWAHYPRSIVIPGMMKKAHK